MLGARACATALLVLSTALVACDAREIASLSARRHLIRSVSQPQGRAARKSVESAAATVIAEARPLLFSELFSDPRRDDGYWRLIWSSQTADSLLGMATSSLPSSVLGGECVQRIAGDDVQNIVRWGDEASSITLVGSASVRVQKLGRRIRRLITITGLDVLRNGVRALTLFDLRALVDSEQTGDTGYLEDEYNDGVLRISRANNGFVYIYSRELAPKQWHASSLPTESDSATKRAGAGGAQSDGANAGKFPERKHAA